ncbi:hypothetical protein HK100_001966 [Physocladia obscura]|uniref:T6SS Phospholipase effector Tle1-like catalytic domain-containing protein n=1 Tax=Physocladia obscura TaxID=109957 RepID=A0AAD5SY37_9FUNG|nr:hypothetical protein HK100_001966 [Physocladia obscura]
MKFKLGDILRGTKSLTIAGPESALSEKSVQLNAIPVTTRRKLVVLIDGTGCHPGISKEALSQGKIKAASAITQSNVYIMSYLLNAVESKDQLVYYHPGPGTNLDDKFQTSEIKANVLENLVGNIDEYVLDVYSWLVSNYKEGDQIYAFGHSRGAAIARTLFSFIRYSGLLKVEKLDNERRLELVERAYNYYRTKEAVEGFKQHHSYPIVDLQFLGLWDTVPALDIPIGILSKACAKFLSEIGHIAGLIEYNAFHNFNIGTLPYAYHALSRDEVSTLLPPIMFERVDNNKTIIDRRQHWFRGFHADVGGEEFERGLSDITLSWMVENARRAGLFVSDPSVYHRNLHPFLAIGISPEFVARRHFNVLHVGWSFHLPGEDKPRDLKTLMDPELFYPSQFDESVDSVVFVPEIELNNSVIKEE